MSIKMSKGLRTGFAIAGTTLGAAAVLALTAGPAAASARHSDGHHGHHGHHGYHSFSSEKDYTTQTNESKIFQVGSDNTATVVQTNADVED